MAVPIQVWQCSWGAWFAFIYSRLRLTPARQADVASGRGREATSQGTKPAQNNPKKSEA